MDIRGYFSSKRDDLAAGVYFPERNLLVGPTDLLPDVELDDEPHVCLMQPGERWLVETTAEFQRGEMTQTRYETLLLLQVVRKSQTDAEGHVIVDGGRPRPGVPVWERSDIEWLEGDTHKPGGFLRNLKNAVGAYIAAAKEAVGNSPRG